MDIGIVSMRYAKALMEYAKSTGTEDRLYTEMRTLSRSFEKHFDLRAALENPVLPVQEKFSLICTEIALPICCMPKWSYRPMLTLPSKADLYSTSTISVWMPVLLPS